MLNNGYFNAIMAGAIWGLIGIGSHNLSSLGLNSYEISFLRVFYAFLFGLIYLKIGKIKNERTSNKIHRKFYKKHIPWDVWKYLIVIGSLSQGALNIFFSKAVTELGTITAVLLLATGPLFTVIMCRVFFNEKLSFYKGIAIIAICFGATLLLTEGNFYSLKFGYYGIFLGLMSGVCYGFYPIGIKKIGLDYDPVKLTIYTFGIASLFLMLFIKPDFIKIAVMPKVILGGLFYGIIPTLIAYILFARAVRTIPVSTVSILSLIEIPSATLFGVFFLSETIGFYKGLGILIMAVGMVALKLIRK